MAMSDQVIHNFDFNKLIEFASTAKGDVYLKTPEGDILNLKSRLTQLLDFQTQWTGAMWARQPSPAPIPMTSRGCSA